MGNTWERYEGLWARDIAVDSPPPPTSGTWGYLWRVGTTLLSTNRTRDPHLGTRDGLLDDRCYRATGDIVAVRSTSADGTVTESGDPAIGMSTMSWCDLECGELPEPFPTGFFDRMVD